jgi:hypothetical protein
VQIVLGASTIFCGRTRNLAFVIWGGTPANSLLITTAQPAFSPGCKRPLVPAVEPGLSGQD